MKIDLIQFLMPRGVEVPVTTNISDDCASAYAAVQKLGFQLHAEMLTTGEVSCTIFDPKTEEDIAISVTVNGPEVPLGIEHMLRNFDAKPRRTRKARGR